ncbi:hypothetical protein P9314_10545 [Paenibacillus validus]|uniref:hypothetical protein n=1 Tax=Paenibacillus TaxID=44249 RepID=UPI001F207CA9|nr:MULTISPECIES: hypothetical protein [Paenibacillus]MED4601141.1 hypothetical protein [Paenibacillus validus]MED4609577.1 hypothetical protein [Paenibacillus validus]
MNESAAVKWSKTRQMGKAKYVMFRGVLLWGVSLTVLFTAIEWMTQHTMLTSWLTVRLIVFGIIGFLIANVRWDGQERAYLARTNHQQGKPGTKSPNKPKRK